MDVKENIVAHVQIQGLPDEITVKVLRYGEWGNAELSNGPILKVPLATALRWKSAQENYLKSKWPPPDALNAWGHVAIEIENLLPEWY